MSDLQELICDKCLRQGCAYHRQGYKTDSDYCPGRITEVGSSFGNTAITVFVDGTACLTIRDEVGIVHGIISRIWRMQQDSGER